MSALQAALTFRASRLVHAFLIAVLALALGGCAAMAPFFARPGLKPTGAAATALANRDAAVTAASLAAARVPGLPVGDPATTNTLNPDAVAVPGGGAIPVQPAVVLKTDSPIVLAGQVRAPRSGDRFAVQAVSGDVVTDATVTLISSGGKSEAIGKTDSAGVFKLYLASFVPAVNGHYYLEAVKGLGPNAPGKDSPRFRTIVKWTGAGWLSCTNGTNPVPPAPDSSIVINSLTTAVALEIALDSNLSMSLGIGKVDATANALKATPAFPNHSDAEIAALAADLTTFLTNDIDPIGSVGAIKPNLGSLSAGSGFPGALLTITGSGFLPVSGGNTVKFGTTAAPVYLATATKLIVGVPSGAASGNVTVTTNRGGTSNGLPFNVTAGVSILVKTNNILAPYYISGAESVPQPGNRNVTVYPGTSQVVFSTGQAATFVVSTDGTVDASLSNGALTGLPGEIDFNTISLAINPNGYAGNYVLNGGFMPSSITGNGSALVLKGLLAYQMVAGTVHLFDMDSAGTVTPRLAWATGAVGSLTFANSSLTVQANGYTGNWSINGVTASAQTGTVVLSVPKASSGYVFNVLGTAFTFDVSGTNVVTTTSSYATGGTNSLTLNMVSVQVDAKGFTGQWTIGNVTSGWVRDTQTVTMMKNFNYRISFWPGNSYVAFGVDAGGGLSIQSAGGQATTGVVTASAGKLTFTTDDVVINSAGWKGYYGLLYGSTPGSWTWLQPTAGDPNWVIGNRTYKVLLGMTSYYYLYFYPGTGEDYVNLNITAGGVVQAMSGSVRISTDVATYGTKSVQFNTVMVPVNTNNWGGNWGLLYGDGPSRGWSWLTSANGDPNWIIGNRNFMLLKGVTDYYYLNFWPGANGNYHAVMSVDKNGVVSDKAAGTAAPVTDQAVTCGAASIALNVADVTINTNGWGGWYGMFYGTSPSQGWTWLPTSTNDPNWVFGNKTYKMVRGIQNYYYLWFYPGGTGYYLTLDLAAGSDTLTVGLNGNNVTTSALASTTSRTITFNTTNITVNPNKWTGYYGLLYGHSPQQGWSWLGDGSGNPNWVNDSTGNSVTKTYKVLKGMVDYYHFSYWPDPTKYRVVFNVDGGASPTISRVGTGSNATKGALWLNGVNTDSSTTTTLTVPTSSLEMDEGNWEGYWGFLYGAGPSQGWTWLTSQTGEPNWVKKAPSQANTKFSMVKGLTDYYYLYFWPGGTGNYWLNLNLSDTDVLTAKENGGPVHTTVATYTSGANPKVTFNTTLTSVDPNGFRAYWGILYGISASMGWTWTPATNGEAWWQFNNQKRDFWLLRGIDNYYFVYFWPGASDDYVQFKNDPSTGAVSYVDKGARFGAQSILFQNPSAASLKFNTQKITIDNNGWRGYHGMFYGNSPQQGWTWLNSESGEWWVIGKNYWYLIKDTTNYFQHIFWPIGANYYRSLNVSSTGVLSSPEGGAPVTSSVYSSVSGSTLTMNTGDVYFNNNGYGGATGMMYGISPQQGWTWVSDEDSNNCCWAESASAAPTNRRFKMLRGISNYYFITFWPWEPYLNFNLDGSNNIVQNQGGSSNVTANVSVVTVSAGQLRASTCLENLYSNVGTPRWLMYYGETQSKNTAFDMTGSRDWVNVAYPTTRQWRLLKGMSNYWWWAVEGKTGYISWSTNTAGDPTWGWGGTFNGQTFYASNGGSCN